MRRTSLLCLALASTASADVWLDVTEGERLYREAGGYGCAVCHGQVGDGGGQAGGYIRGASLDQLNESLLTNAPMQPLSSVLSEQDRLNISAYLADLAERPLITARFENGQWVGQAEPVSAGQTVDLVLYNATFEPLVVDFPVLEQPLTLPALGTDVWTGVIQDPTLDLPGLTLERL